jgi:hypothetical protein
LALYRGPAFLGRLFRLKRFDFPGLQKDQKSNAKQDPVSNEQVGGVLLEVIEKPGDRGVTHNAGYHRTGHQVQGGILRAGQLIPF